MDRAYQHTGAAGGGGEQKDAAALHHQKLTMGQEGDISNMPLPT